MKPLVLSEPGSGLKVSHQRLIFNGEAIEPHPAFDSVIIDTHRGYITFEAVKWLSVQNIPVFFPELARRIGGAVLAVMV